MATTTSTTDTKKLQVTELDFDQIKTNLKQFLKDQSEFADYDFEGSGMAVLLDLLAYNTHYLGFNANMLANEMYLDSADIRKNIVSLAKMLGYTPTSPKSPTAFIDITVNNVTGSPATITAAKGTAFTTTVDGQLECNDGTLCLMGYVDGGDSSCCNEHGGRAKCPPDKPHMCADATGCADGQDYCCSSFASDCSHSGGLRPCSGTYVLT